MRQPAFAVICIVLISVFLPQTLQAQSATSTSSSTTSGTATGDSQALSVIQGAITALGGQTAISPLQSWTAQASLQGGLINNGSVNYTIGWDSPPGIVSIPLFGGTVKRRAPMIHSLFVPVMIGSILVHQMNDSDYSVRYIGPATVGQTSAVVVAFSISRFPNVSSQTWAFDATTKLPIRVQFTLPVVIGSAMSYSGIIDLSDYQSVGGVLHPFRIVTQLLGRPPEVITVTSVTPSTTPSTNSFNTDGGDVE